MKEVIIFSVIVPVYGVEKYLPQCVESLLKQTYQHIEIILVDDGSKDKCPQICDHYAAEDNRITVIHKQNSGLVSARQAGVAVAHGEYVVCVDGDDWVDNDYIEQFAMVVKRYSPDVILCGSKWSWKQKELVVPCNLAVGNYNRNRIEKEIFPRLIHTINGKGSFQAQLWAKAFRRLIYQQQQLVDVVVNMGEDRACTIPTVYHSQSLYVLNTYGYHYRQIETSMTKVKKPFVIDGPEIIHQHLCQTMDMNKFGLMDQMYRATCHSLFNVCVSQFYSSMGYLKVCYAIKKVLQCPIYKEAVEKAVFRNSVKHSIMRLALRYRLYAFLFLYAKIRK